MARALGCTVTAEGVETEEQLDALRALDCERVQGFLLARPLPAHELDRAAGSPNRRRYSADSSHHWAC